MDSTGLIAVAAVVLLALAAMRIVARLFKVLIIAALLFGGASAGAVHFNWTCAIVSTSGCPQQTSDTTTNGPAQ